MHCNICDKQLSEIEINWNKDLKTYEPCAVCLEVIMETAYSGKFTRSEENIEVIGPADPDVETLDPEEVDPYAFDVVSQFRLPLDTRE